MKSLRALLMSLLLVAVAGSSGQAARVAVSPAATARLRELLTLPNRPTIEQVADAAAAHNEFHELMDKYKPIKPQRGQGVAHWLELMSRDVPFLIASMEFTYPGATWAFIGRDSSAIADMVEAFYLSLGQKDRIRRINVSSASLESAQADPSLMKALLAQEGLTTSIFTDVNAHPFIFIDTVSKGNGRQARAFVTAAYKDLLMEAGPNAFTPIDILNKVNVFGLLVSTYKGQEFSFTSPTNYLNNQTRTFANYARAIPQTDFSQYYDHHQFMSYHQQPDWSNESGYEHFTYAWHDSFGKITKDEETGRVSAKVGAKSRLSVRRTILWSQLGIIKIARSRDFVERVRLAALQLGYEFPESRPETAVGLKKATWTDRDLLSYAKMLEENTARFKQKVGSGGLKKILKDTLVAWKPHFAGWEAAYRQQNRVPRGKKLTMAEYVNGQSLMQTIDQTFGALRKPETFDQAYIVEYLDMLAQAAQDEILGDQVVSSFAINVLRWGSPSSELARAVENLKRISPMFLRTWQSHEKTSPIGNTWGTRAQTGILFLADSLQLYARAKKVREANPELSQQGERFSCDAILGRAI